MERSPGFRNELWQNNRTCSPAINAQRSRMAHWKAFMIQHLHSIALREQIVILVEYFENSIDINVTSQ